jgi:HlyD family secretion protein
MAATMSIRGTATKIPLEFVRLQPYVTPKIELSDQRLERVDLRVLPAIFRFQPPAGIEVYPGEMVDVYIGEDEAATHSAPTALRSKSQYVGRQGAMTPSALLEKRQ